MALTLDKSLPLSDPGFYERKGEMDMQFTNVSSGTPVTNRLAKNWSSSVFQRGNGAPTQLSLRYEA